MKPVILIISVLQFISSMVLAQSPIPPLVRNNYSKVTSYEELATYVQLLGSQATFLKVEIAGKSVSGRNFYALKFSTSEFGRDSSKIKVLIFAQQHGNEQSGKEGALLLAQELLKTSNRYLFDKIDLVLVPQVNPDGSEMNIRRNAHGADLNRNHLILTEPETMALHDLFDRYLFEVTMDVHEYSPYGEDWKQYGYRRNFDVTIGATTNLNVAESIRNLSDNVYIPFLLKYLNDRKFSSFTYCPGGPPEVAYIRHSTFDINDGRQSFGIQNTFSFIQEGMNGSDDSIEGLQRRAEGQMTGMRGLLEYVYRNKDTVKSLVSGERKRLVSPDPDRLVCIQSEHVPNGKTLKMPLLSYHTGNDTLVIVKDYRPVVKSICNVQKPLGYLIPRDCEVLVEWARRQGLEQTPMIKTTGYKIGQYMINRIDSADFEGDRIVDPRVTLNVLKELPANPGYIFIPVAQLKGNLVVLALEPGSMLGLVTYEKYASLLQVGKPFPVLPVLKK
jgi:hypothetical protein